MIRERGAALSRQGVRFHDLTEIFADVEAEVYLDNCCHVNELGNRILASKIGDIVSANLTGVPLQP